MGQPFSREESFFSKQPRDIHVCDAATGADLLTRAEWVDQYRGSCGACRLNGAARQGQDYTTRQPTSDSIPFYTAVEQFPQWLRNYLPPILYVVYLANSADGGMPHTRPQNIVCLPLHMRVDDPAGQTTFMHECIHIHQRTHPDLWKRLYREILELEPYKGPLPDSVQERRRLNPDTIAEPLYVWRGQWVAVPVFTQPDAPQLSAVKILYYNVRTGAWQAFMPPEMVAEFGPLSTAQAEHPAELAAYLLSEGGSGGNSNSSISNHLKRSFEERLVELLADAFA
jgi:hypothetical protein